jgi:hypothetical protein
MKNLDKAIIQHYDTWVADAPLEYTQDNFFSSRVPVAITSRFGQNQQLAESIEDRRQERLNWRQDRDYSKIRYLTIAIASHIRSVL